jgi:hypothetical protein
MACRLFEEHAQVRFRRGQIADQQRDRACRLGQGVTQREYMIGGASFPNAIYGRAYCLIWKSFQPQHPGEQDARHNVRRN